MVAGNNAAKITSITFCLLVLTKEFREGRLTLEQITQLFEKKIKPNKETELIGLRGSLTTLLVLRDMIK